MKSYFRELFSFTDRERNGTIVLLVLILLVAVFIFLQDEFISLPQENFSKFDQFIAALDDAKSADSLLADDEKTKRENNFSPFPSVADEAGTHSVYHTKELFNFNPNGLSEDDWVRLGLSPAQARCVKKYEANGGKFQSKEDVKKMFVISAERYAELEPYIVLPEKSPVDSVKKYADNKFPKKKIGVVVELNTADSSDLIAVNGIGPAFAKRILEYRERLGGFYKIDQLTEVFGIDTGKFAAIKKSFKADSSYIRKINVNTAGISDFRKMPYISPGVANALVNYRKVHGNYKSVGDIRGCVLVNADLYRKIAPYLTI
jgi:competence protein ComEA